MHLIGPSPCWKPLPVFKRPMSIEPGTGHCAWNFAKVYCQLYWWLLGWVRENLPSFVALHNRHKNPATICAAPAPPSSCPHNTLSIRAPAATWRLEKLWIRIKKGPEYPGQATEQSEQSIDSDGVAPWCGYYGLELQTNHRRSFQNHGEGPD